jgi:peptidoglycan/LPS O-acetylase OafA/YrhL
MPAVDGGGRSLEYAPELDGARGLAILLVLIWHYYMLQVAAAPGSMLTWISHAGLLAWSGVDLFFVLSGFLLGSILIRHRGADRYYAAFYLRRVCRIVPPYALLLAAYLVCAAWLSWRANPGLRWLFDGAAPFWTYATFTQNFAMALEMPLRGHFLAVTWSLAIEEQFYLVLPLLIALLSPRRLPWCLGALIVLAAVLRWSAPSRGLDLLMPLRMDSLLAGTLLAVLMQAPGSRAWLESRLSLLRLLFGVALVGVLLLTGKPAMMGVFHHTWLAGFYVLLLALALLGQGAIGRFLRTPFLVALGPISYSVYLFHQPVSGLMHAAIFGRAPRVDDLQSALITLTALALTLGIGVLTLRLIERPAITFGRRYGYRAAETQLRPA